MKKSSGVLLAALAVATLWTVAPAAAAPIGSPLVLRNAVETSSVETVRYRRGYGPAIGLGIAGALIGGAIIGATQQPYGYYGHPGYYGPGYYGPAYVVAPPYVGGGAVAYCAQRYRSYDPYSGTYLGYDGYRHPCP